MRWCRSGLFPLLACSRGQLDQGLGGRIQTQGMPKPIRDRERPSKSGSLVRITISRSFETYSSCAGSKIEDAAIKTVRWCF
jgi:hypothetical protein